MKKVLVLCLMIVLLLTAVGCGTNTSETLKIAALKGPSGVGLAFMPEGEDYALEIYDAPDVVTGKFISGEADVACVPVNLASVLYKKLDGNVVLLAVNTLGVLYVLENGDSIASVKDLAGKTVYASGQGSTPEYVLNHILAENGLTDQVTVEYVGEHAALAAMAASGEADVAMLPEPNVSAVLAKNPDLRVALDLTKEWGKVSDTPLVQGCTITTRSFYEAHKKQISQLLTDYAASVAQVLTDETAAERVAELGILPSAALAKSAIPQCNIVCLTGDEAATAVQGMLTALFAADPSSVGGALPNDNFYALS